MSKPSRQFGRSARLMTETASASAAVIAARVSKLGDPREFMSARQQREIGGMVSEKMIAGMRGWTSAVAEAWLLPSRAMATLPGLRSSRQRAPREPHARSEPCGWG